MFARNRKLLRSAIPLTIVLISAMALFAPVAHAVNSADSPAILNDDEAGNYEVDFGVQCSADCQLKESTNFGGSWQTVASGNAEGNNLPPYVATNKPDGTYFYKTRDLEYDEDTQQGIVTYSEVSEVTVGPVNNPPTLEDQLAYDYETRLGDINGDGLQDIFLNRTTVTPPNNGTIKSVILKQVVIGQAKSFDLFFPSQGQATQASSWPTVPLRLISTELNLDGFADIAIKGIATYISGMDDQLVYSPAVAFTDAPRTIRAMDAGFIDFMDELINYYRDPDFFTNSAVTVVSGGFYTFKPSGCAGGFFSEGGWDFTCGGLTLVWVPETTQTTYPGINDAAVGVWETLIDAEAGLGSWETVVGWFENQLNVNILYGPWCVKIFGNDDGPACPSAALAAILTRLHQVRETPEAAINRTAGVVYITKRALKLQSLGLEFTMHTALEFRAPLSLIPPETISGHERNRQVTGTLVSTPNWSSDNPIFMTTAGTVSSASAPELYFLALLLGENNYGSLECLPYQATPALLLGPGYNSNGFLSGLITATGGTPSINLADFTGGPNPVPPEWFTSSPQCP